MTSSKSSGEMGGESSVMSKIGRDAGRGSGSAHSRPAVRYHAKARMYLLPGPLLACTHSDLAPTMPEHTSSAYDIMS